MLENFGKKVKEYGENIRQSTQNFSESVSINNRIKDLAKECDQTYLVIGRKYYEECQNNVPDNYREEFGAVRGKLDQIEVLQKSLRKYTGIWQCPNCGAENPSDAQFCSKCGKKRTSEEKRDGQPGSKVCPRCGTPYHEGDVFCGNCGFRLDTLTEGVEESGQTENMTASQAKENCGIDQYQPEQSISKTNSRMENPAEVDVTLQKNMTTTEPEPDTEFEAGTVQKEYTESEENKVFEANMESEADIEKVNVREEGIFQNTLPSETSIRQEQSVEQVASAEGTVPPIMFCPNCGARLSAGSIFCEDCGTRVR